MAWRPLLLVAATLLAYLPALWHAGFIWDDDAHVTKPALRSVEGLARIWIEPGASQQYYPVAHSVFWLEHRLWGDHPRPYHLVNVLLHAGCALLLGQVLRRLAVPGAWLAAAIFALHPVQVETAAWVTELKNTLSGVCYLGAAWCYLEFDGTRKGRAYAGALGLFLLGLTSKTVIASLPAALLVVFWWKRGRLSWRTDVRPLAPFFAAGIALGLFTAWVEHRFIGANGGEFQFTAVERCLIAGRATWFYLGKLLWPAELIFVYPRWHVSQAVWWQWLFPLAGLALAAALWAWRHRSRAPLAALLFFGGTLFPALGFVNVFPFRYSFVADHFQYLAGIGPIALVSAGIALGMSRGQRATVAGRVLIGVGLLTLAVLTRQQCRMYEGVKTLWETTLRRNPDAWLAHNNLSPVYLSEGNAEGALAAAERALALKPDYREAAVNLGNARLQRGDPTGAIAAYRQALAIEPGYWLAENNLGNALMMSGRLTEAIPHFESALRIHPDFLEAESNLGHARLQHGDVERAVEHFQKALARNPDSAAARAGLGAALARRGEAAEAMAQFRRVLEIQPGLPQAEAGLGDLLLERGQAREAAGHFQAALASAPGDPRLRFNLGMARMQVGEVREAMAQWRKSQELAPANAFAPNQLAWVMATWPEATVRDGPQALHLAEEAVRLSGGNDPVFLDTLAAAQAECGDFPAALETARRALELARAGADPALTDALRARLQLYGANSPYREPSPAGR